MGWTEWLIILVVAALLFRPRQFGGAVGRAAGDAAGSFREGLRHGAAKSGGTAGGASQHAADDAPAERTRLLAVLELQPGASAEQVRQAWRDLARVWHPDRFAHDPALQARATARLAEINAAYAQLQRDAARA